MKYFELFGWQAHFDIDIAALKKKYHALSRESHPDFYTLESNDAQSESLKDSTDLNLAYKTLKNPRLLLKYILEEEGAVLEGKDANMSQGFLMEMMEINETIMELQFDPDEDKMAEAKKAFQDRVKALELVGDKLKADYDAGLLSENLNDLRQYYFEKKYLNRMEENLNNSESEI